MLSQDLTNLCRDVFLRARQTDDAATRQYLDRLAGRLQVHRDEAAALEKTVIPRQERAPVLIDLSDDKIAMFPRVCLPPPYGGDNNDGGQAA